MKGPGGVNFVDDEDDDDPMKREERGSLPLLDGGVEEDGVMG